MFDLELVKKLQEWLLASGVGFAINLVVFLLILFFGRFIIKGILRVSHTMLNRSTRITETLEKFVQNVFSKILWVVLLMIALPRLGVDIAPLIAGLGVTGFIVGFAFQESLGNLAAGLMIILNEPFRIGDFVEAGGHAGVVQEINMMATSLTTPDNKKVVIPNRTIWGGPVVNYSALDTRRVDLSVGISYAADIGKARDAIYDVLRANDKVLPDPAPVVELVEMADSSLNLVIRPWSQTADYWDVYFSVNRAVKERLDQEGIEIPFPQMDVHHHGLPPHAV
ncbi:MAG: mechanosensitive ion channel family protein [Candidatus Lernaella stagnicola]|nr:mechanosensitive ion channel family protein [Candidatus Lernaella stagnicola]